MEHNDPSQPPRHYAPDPYAAQRTQQAAGQVPSQLPGQYHSQSANQRFQQPSFAQQSPTTPSSAGRAGSDGQQMYGYQQSLQYPVMPAVQSSAMSYSQTNQAQEPQRQQQQSPYQSYGGNVYAMAPPPNPQAAAASVYEQVPQYRQRPSAPETFGAQFGVPQTTPYYLAGQAGPTSAPAPGPAAPLPSQYQAATYPHAGQTLPQSYPSAMMVTPQAATYASYSQQTQQTQYTVQQPEQSADQAFNAYNQNVRSIFLQARDGTLHDVGQQLLQISQYLLGNVEALGLTRDDADLHDDRIRLWDEFNCAWLTTLQRQLDMTDMVLRGGEPLQAPQSLLTAQTLEQLSRELVRLCDSIEKHGLVDYQMGVAEEEILGLVIRCLGMLDPPSTRTEEAPRPEPSVAGAGRAR
ncbi:hypothetical protein LTR53_013066 [Teratosphaeriaceae sp. CCFEE 6253]|nr:hypothetical protein LTR53_013066 [Teratosphaeriaceae sp. CCFEE 6253]